MREYLKYLDRNEKEINVTILKAILLKGSWRPFEQHMKLNQADNGTDEKKGLSDDVRVKK